MKAEMASSEALSVQEKSLNIHGRVFSSDHLRMDLLVCGETGTGKDTVAQEIHRLSGRRGDFVGINCAAIPEALAESELFGTMSGAFTGAGRARQGYIEASNGGTLYLDEIDSMSLTLQAKLLRTLEVRGIERLGSTSFIPVDLRVIASTQRPLGGLVELGHFRRDLLYRVNALSIRLPTLRSQRDQILPMFEQFYRAITAELKQPVRPLDNKVIQLLLSHSWPGNIRELKSAAKRFAIGFPPLAEMTPIDSGGVERADSAGLKAQLKNIEAMLIRDALKRHDYSLDLVIKELNISRRSLHQRMKELNL